MAKIKFNNKNPISEYIVKKFLERYPDGTLYALSKGIDRNIGTLYKTLKAENAWQQCVLLQDICGYLGIPIEEALLQEKFQYDHKEEIEQWKKMYYESENKNTVLQKELDSLKIRFDKINKLSAK